MNTIEIFAPRWHDRKLLIAPWKVGNHNEIRVGHHSLPEPLYMSGQKLRQYPQTKVERKNQASVMMYEVPIADFITLSEKQDILSKVEEIYG